MNGNDAGSVANLSCYFQGMLGEIESAAAICDKLLEEPAGHLYWSEFESLEDIKELIEEDFECSKDSNTFEAVVRAAQWLSPSLGQQLIEVDHS